MATEPDGFGLDKDARLAAERESEREEKKKTVRITPKFPYLVKAPDIDFFSFANPKTGAADPSRPG